MKKSLFILPFAALAMASCSNDEVVNQAVVDKTPSADNLKFQAVVQGSTRATSTTTATLDAFKVKIDGKFQKSETNTELWTADQLQDITKAGSSWVFPDGVEYWWADKSSPAKFTAWAPTTWANGQDLTDGGASITVDNDIKKQIDYLVAYNQGIREDFDAGVPINFQHVLSQIVIKALNKNPDDIVVEVAGMKLMNAKNSNSVTLPTKSTAAGTFSWDDYKPYASAPGTTTGTYTSVANDIITQSGATTLTSAATNLADPMLLMPQQLTKCELDQQSTPMNGNYLAVLVRVTTKAKVGYRDAEGHYYSDASTPIAFTAKRKTTDASENTYTANQLAALEKGDAPTGADAISGVTTVYTKEQTLYPREGFGTTSEKFAYVGVSLDQEWLPGYKYTYTLNFSKDGIGKSIADQPTDAAQYNKDHDGYNFPYGNDYETGNAEQPGEDIVDNPTQLFFTVTVDEWTDASPINEDM